MQQLILKSALAAGLCGALMLAAVPGDSAGQVIVPSHTEADGVQGGLCAPSSYYTLNIYGFGIFHCGGPTKDAQASCEKATVAFVGLGPLRKHEGRNCLECGESCGYYEYIRPTTCSAG